VLDSFCRKKATFLSEFSQMYLCLCRRLYNTKYYNTVSDCRTGPQGFASVEISHDCSHKRGGGGSLDLLGFLCVTEETLRSTAIILLYTKLLNQGL
jgi:hypothetical protein